MDADIKLLRAFAEVARFKSFTRTAAKLNISQPQVTVRIQNLEKLVGYPVFQRDSRHLELTPRGAALLQDVTAFLQHADKMATVLHQAGADPDQWIKIGAPPLLSHERFVRLARFARQFPKARPRVMINRSRELLERVRQGKLDLAYIMGPVPHDLDGMELWQSRHGLLLEASHPLAAHEKVRPAQLTGLEILTFSHRSSPMLHAAIARLMDGLDVRVTDMIEGWSEEIFQHVERSGGVVIAPEIWSDEETRPANIVHRPLQGLAEPVCFSLVRPRSPLSKTAQDLWDMTLGARSGLEALHAPSTAAVEPRRLRSV